MFYDDEGQIRLTYKGKSQTLKEWAADPDSVVDNASTIKNRVVKLKWDDEKCLTFPVRETKPRYITAWGETRRVTDWFNDERCKVTNIETLYRRLQDGKDPEEALTTPSGHMLGTIVTAWGETKMPGEWQEDCRCRVHARTIVKRMEAGMAPEAAIRNPSLKPIKRTPQELFEREVAAQRLLKEVKGFVPLSALQRAAKEATMRGSEVSFSNRHPDGDGSFCLGVWTDLRTLPRLAYATAAEPAISPLLWKSAGAPQRMHDGYLYLFRHWFATDDDGVALFE